MAYTGSGTQEDPYIPETLHDFIEVINITDAYVKVTHDIDGNDDPLGGEINSSIAFNCKECVGEKPEGGRPAIKNVVQVFINSAGSVYYFATSGLSVKNLIFYNIESKNAYRFITNGLNGSSEFKNTNFSIRIIPALGSNFTFQEGCDLTDCGINLTFKTNNIKSFEYLNTYFIKKNVRTNIVIKGLKCQIINLRAIDFIRSAIIFDSLSLIDTSTSNTICRDSQHSYFAFINSSLGSITSHVSTVSDSLVCCDNATTIGNIGGGFIEITPENLKDKQYLIDLGFLP